MPYVLIALGGGHNVWHDFAKASALCDRNNVPYDVGAVNDAGKDYTGRLALWCSLHPEKIAHWQRDRARKKLNTTYWTVCHKHCADASVDLTLNEVWSGSSGLFICQVALITFGYAKVICCGMPMMQVEHYFNSDPWRAAVQYRRGWIEAKDQPEMAGRVRSMSGWTSGLLGTPDVAWLLDT
jgi:hypothetical protein